MLIWRCGKEFTKEPQPYIVEVSKIEKTLVLNQLWDWLLRKKSWSQLKWFNEPHWNFQFSFLLYFFSIDWHLKEAYFQRIKYLLCQSNNTDFDSIKLKKERKMKKTKSLEVYLQRGYWNCPPLSLIPKYEVFSALPPNLANTAGNRPRILEPENSIMS